jgi:LysR family glycine cleavage system transcriptional activator
MRKLPPLNAVRAFESAARHVSFSKAAKELFVTHGAVSKQVATLESWLGTALFNRTQSQLSLTEAGKTLLASVTPALDRISVAALQLIEQNESSVLRINAPPTFTMRWLIPRLSSFQRRYPGAEIKLTTSTAPVRFEENGYDMAIRGAHQPFAGMVSVPFMTEDILPICHPDLLEKGALREPADLSRHTLISYDTEPVAWRDWLALTDVPTLRPHHSLQFEQMFFALQAAAEGLGVVLVPLFLVADEVIAGRLCAPFGVGLSHKRQYFACSAIGPDADGVLAAFVEWLLKEGHDTEQSINLLGQAMMPA